MKRIGKKVAILLAVMALTGGYVHTASMTAQVTAASPEELQKSAWEKLLANNAGALTEEEKNSLNQVFNNISAWDQYIRLYSTYTQVIGGDNHAVDSNSIQGRAVYGGNHQYVSDAAATLGQQGNNFGTNSVVVGYQPSAFGENSIAMGTGATTFPIKYGENFAGYANAIGADAWSGDMGNAFGAGAVAMGQGSVAIGTMAVAGSPDIQKYISRNKYEYQPYFEQLQKAYPNIFGETQPNEGVTERSERMGQQIFKEYSTYFKKIGINDFTTFKTRVSQWEAVLQKLGWHMALSKDARHHVTALGFGATATATGGVALGAFSEADRGTVTEKAPFSEFELTNQNTLGAVSVGNKTFLRQLINVADGTEATDAVNLRQLQGLETKLKDAGGSVHYFSVNPDNNKRTKPAKGSDNSKNDGAYGENSVAIGAFAEAADKNTLALGWSVKALGQDSLALGTMVYSYGLNSNAVGNQAAALGEESSAFGNQAKAMDMGTTALGNNAMAIQNGSTAVGYQSLSAVSSTSMGTNSYALGQASLALGQRSYIGDTTFRDTYTKYNEEKGNDNNIPGYYISDLIKKNDPKIAKYKEQFKNQLQGLDGHNQEAVLRYLIIADLNKSVQFATAVGNHSTVGASQGTALGFYSTVTGAYGTALGYNSIATAYGAMASGAYAKANTVGSVAIGFQSKVNNYGGVAIGSEATVGKNGGVALGNKSTADRGSGAVGYVFGADNSTLTKALEAPGNKARFDELKMKIKDEDVSAYNALVMTFKNAAKDSPEKEKAKQEIEKWKAAHPDFLKNVKARKAFENAWQSTYEAVSVGDVEKGITRQITGVAAGSEDTDAVNVAQLKVLNTKVDKVAANSGVHYLSVNSSEQGAGSNYKNDGAKGVHAVAIGAYATADSVGGVSLGRDSTAKREGGLFGYNPKNGAAFVDGTAVAEYLGKTTEYDALQTEMTAKKTAVEEAKAALKDNPTDTTKKENLNKAYQALEEVQQKENLLLGAYRSASGYGAFSVGNEEKGITRQITGVAAGTKDTDAVNVAQLKALEKKVGTAGKDGKSAYEIWRDHTVDGKQPNKDKSEQEFLDSLKGKNGKDGEKGKDGVNGTKGTDGKNGTNGKSAYEIWRDHEENGTQPNKDKSEQEFLDSLKGKDGKDGTGADIDIQGNDTGIVVVDKKTDTAGKTKYTLGLGTKIKAGEVTIDGTENKENIAVGDVKINGEKGHGTVTGLSNTTWDEKHVVSGRAATEDQLQAVSQKNRQAISELGTRMERGTASAAALAALHPQEFDPADKWDFAVGYSNYRSANTFAFGGFYRPNERTLVSLGGTFGGENIVNVGLSFKTGKGSDGISTSRVAMAREIQVLKEKDAAKDRIMQELLQVQKKKEAEIQALKEKDGQREEQIRKLTAMVMELKK